MFFLREMISYLKRGWKSRNSRSTDDADRQRLPYHLPELTFSSPQLSSFSACDYSLPELKFSAFDSLSFKDYLIEQNVEKREEIENIDDLESATAIDRELVAFFSDNATNNANVS